MGRNFSGPELGTGNPVVVTAQLAARKGIARGFDVGVEGIVVSVESAPTPRGRAEPGSKPSSTRGWTAG
ncbi:MAG: hypothetical protein AB7H93_04205 [Vicinamibacterales bacterium]